MGQQVKIRDIVEFYRNEQQLTLREFAAALSEQIIPTGGIPLSHPTIINWQSGRTEPPTDLLLLCLVRYRDWRFDWALRCLAIKRPEIWGPDGGLGPLVSALRNGGPDPLRVDTIPQDSQIPQIEEA